MIVCKHMFENGRKTGERNMKLRRIWILAVITVLLLTGCTGQEMSFENQQTYASQSAKKTNQKGTADDFGLEVHYLNVGQGDCTLIRTKDKTMLIDAGDNSQGTEVQSYLDSQKIEKLDYVIGTHPDADHIGGLDVVIEEFQCKKVLMPDVTSDTQTYHDVEEALEEKNMKAVHPKCGKTYSLGDASFTIIAPVKDYGSETNNWSIGLVLQYGENRFLFTGDADQDAEKDILAEGEDVSADVYKTSHHGSKTGSSEEFLDAVDPEYAVISCGEENKYGHPSAQTLNRLRTRGIKVFRTDNQGTIVASSDGKKITWNTSPDTSWTPGEAKGSSTDWEKDSEKSTKTASSKKSTSSKKKKTSDTKTSYVLNEETKKFHLPSCRYVKKMETENRKKTSDTWKQLIKEGYEACKVCNP